MPFSQVDSSTTRKYGGSGLGLVISRRLVEMMNGRIWVNSEEGRGTEFGFVVQLRKCVTESKNGLASPMPYESYQLHGVRALVVDDDEINRVVARGILEKAGCRVDIADSGKAAIEAIESESYGIVLMDVQMSDMDGYETAREIRFREGISGRPRLPIIALTAHVGGIHSENCRASGIDARLPKPVDPIALIDTVGRLLAGSSAAPMTKNFTSHAESEAASEKESKKDDLMLIPESEPQMPIVQAASKDVFDPMELWERVGEDPEVFGRLIDLFGRRAPDHVAKLKAASDAGDAITVRAEAHSLKGSAANMSAHNTSGLAGQIEQTASQGNLEAVGPLLLKLDQELSNLQQELMSQKCPA